MTNGSRANKRGQMLEEAIVSFLKEDYRQVLEEDKGQILAEEFLAACEEKQPIFAKECYMGENIYGKRRRLDFILYHPIRWPNCLVIQCKWQASSGSVEEKYPFEVLSVKKNKLDTIIVLAGGGYSAGAENWLKAQAGKNNLLYVFNLDEMAQFQSRGKL